MREESAPPDVLLAEVAASQHGVASAHQLDQIGIDKSGVARRVKAGRLHRLHHGIYAVGHQAVSQEGRWMAAVIACGEGAALSHRSAAELWGMLTPRGGPVEVSTSSRGGRAKRIGIHLHRRRSFRPELLTERRRIPVTIPAHTIADLGATLPAWEARRALRQAEYLGLDLGPAIESDQTRSDLERDFLVFCRRHRLPPPEVNVRIGVWTVDFLWRAQRVAVETDFHGTHRGSVAFEDDHRRDLDLRRLGYRVRRYTGAQLRDRPAQVVADLGAVLGCPR